jgi:hypothetical protein
VPIKLQVNVADMQAQGGVALAGTLQPNTSQLTSTVTRHTPEGIEVRCGPRLLSK